ncbi:MAG: hypothetical protein II008_18975 [Oscillospiraceae bacterium]|nr:hypothetical protein [Bacillota bacterium]MBQ1792266.1 hypothetical protein [Oscillospiraceae bacterium]
MRSDEEKRVLVVRAKTMMNYEDYEEIRQTLLGELENGVVLLPPYLEFCCLASADEVHVMQDDLFPCDPDKNYRCTKTSCYQNGGDCYLTKFEDYRK